MPKMLKLYLKPLDPSQTVWFRRPTGLRDSLPVLRLIASVNFTRVLIPGMRSGRYSVVDCVVDTGAHVCVIGEALWRRFLPGYITPLPFDALTPPQHRTITIAGGTFPYELGELTIPLQDQDGTVLPVTVVAKLTRNRGKLPIPLVLGLRGGVFEGRRLHAEPDPAVPFAQAWRLHDP